MKNICIIAGSFIDYQNLIPLINEIRNDSSICLNVIFTESYKTAELSILRCRLEQNGFTMEEKTDIRLNSDKQYSLSHPIIFEQKEYDRLLKKIQPDIVVLYGNAYSTYLAAAYASLNQIPIAHIEGEKSDFGMWDKSYGCEIVKLSRLHFTSSEKYRQQAIKFGEHSDSVFNIGDLLIKNIKKMSLPSETAFFKSIPLKKNTPFLFISFEPDAAEGSANRAIFENILDTVCTENFSDFKLIFSSPKSTGPGEMISKKIHTFTNKFPERAIILPSKDLTDFGCAIKYSTAMISNFFEGLIIAACFKKPVINIGPDIKAGLTNPLHCQPFGKSLFYCLQKVLSDPFTTQKKQTPDSFEAVLTARTIKERIKAFEPEELLLQKEYY